MQLKDTPHIRSLFWDMNVQQLDTTAHAKTIIERVLNYGTLDDWRWLVSVYGTETIRRTLATRDRFGRDNFRAGARRLAELMLH